MIFILLFGAKWCKKGEWNEEATSLSQFKYIQGYMAICILLHHVGQETCAAWQNYPLIPGLEFFVDIGYFFVAVFMFCSGYGLFVSYKKKPDYFKGFFGKRVAPVLFALFTSSWLFLIARIIMGDKMNPYKLAMYISTVGMSNPYCWFAVAMPLFYLIFYICFKHIKSDGGKIAGVAVGVFLYSLVCAIAGHNGMWFGGEWWYNCVHMFWIGMIFARHEDKIIARLKKAYIVRVIVAIPATVGLFYLSQWVTAVVSYYGEYNPYLSYTMVVVNRLICCLAQAIACGFFVFTVFLIVMKVKVGNRFLGFMGTITLEFYLIHGLFLELFSFRFCDYLPSIVRIKNVALLIIVVFALSVPAALLLQKLHKLLQRPLLKNK